MDHGVERPLVRGTDGDHEDIPHCYACALAAWNGGADGRVQPERVRRAVGLHAAPPGSAAELLAVGEGVTLFDNVFASAHGPSFPNHLYTIAAQSGGAHDNPRRRPGLGSNTFGCDAPAEQLVEVVDSEGIVRRCGRASTS